MDWLSKYCSLCEFGSSRPTKKIDRPPFDLGIPSPKASSKTIQQHRCNQTRTPWRFFNWTPGSPSVAGGLPQFQARAEAESHSSFLESTESSTGKTGIFGDRGMVSPHEKRWKTAKRPGSSKGITMILPWYYHDISWMFLGSIWVVPWNSSFTNSFKNSFELPTLLEICRFSHSASSSVTAFRGVGACGLDETWSGS